MFSGVKFNNVRYKMFYERERIYKSELGNHHLEFCVNLTMLARELQVDEARLLAFLDAHTALSIIRKAVIHELKEGVPHQAHEVK